jgi:hypothetical protein
VVGCGKAVGGMLSYGFGLVVQWVKSLHLIEAIRMLACHKVDCQLEMSYEVVVVVVLWLESV